MEKFKKIINDLKLLNEEFIGSNSDESLKYYSKVISIAIEICELNILFNRKIEKTDSYWFEGTKAMNYDILPINAELYYKYEEMVIYVEKKFLYSKIKDDE